MRPTGFLSHRLLQGIVPAVLLAAQCGGADGEVHKVLIRDVASVEGVRDNSLVGYGLVTGLKGTGDKQQTYFTVQTLASILARMGVQIPASVLQSTVQVKNVAAVFVTAILPPFSRPGLHVDVMVSSIGDARSLEGGLLLLTPLYASDGQVYAAAQGPLVVGGYTAGTAANSRSVTILRSGACREERWSSATALSISRTSTACRCCSTTRTSRPPKRSLPSLICNGRRRSPASSTAAASKSTSPRPRPVRFPN